MLADKDIQTRLKEGSKEAFQKLFCHYYPRLRAYVTTIVNEDMVAEDVVQDTFLYLWEHHSEISMNDDIQSYLYRSAYTRCVDYFRKLQQEDQYSASVYEAYAEECETLLEQEGAALEDLYTQDFYQELYHLLQQIPEQRREVFLLAYIEGMKAQEIAEQLDLPKRTVDSHLYLTLKYLKKNMSKKHFLLLLLVMSGCGNALLN